MTEGSIQQEIVRLEQARCRALVEADIDSLDKLVAEDVVHVHANGNADDKAAYLRMVEKNIRFLDASREKLDVRVYGEFAVATGALNQTIEMKESAQRIVLHVMTTQVWARRAGAWQQVSFQATNL
ncbi:nuclear transport factor 2 family protein (plasmid) [Paraburkholderia sp. D15]|uniref:nuclear transport factor 2 family protein n=1 Tax=Paraburkholderia sp. D15 TaxID=2880218 RepID=UPI00247A48A5|nr:nuclear transport factor 2 family protein [Paraburkholderia sp. D15]WGS55136.1 nuclear transport factor 2 family protein [Paraburkholderia sp. D15]